MRAVIGSRGTKAVAVAGIAACLLTACDSVDNRTVKRAGVGAGVGAVTGGVIGAFSGNWGAGAAAGAAIGGAGGYLYDQIKKDNHNDK
ncbi:MAG: hypothetical protein KDC18_15900 [Alphaproteobacteria bacterium]|nr:hypothetical protein [Alphaproteobacteria bacterium]MCB9931088.1 hypothetical protein [Alphaproteobacteria bacterium]